MRYREGIPMKHALLLLAGMSAQQQFMIPEIVDEELIYSCGYAVVHVNPARQTAWFDNSITRKRATVEEHLITVEIEDGGKMQIIRNRFFNSRRADYSFIISGADKQPKSWGYCSLQRQR
jgi:hypothetical protein